MRLFAAIFPPSNVLAQLDATAHAIKILHTSTILVKPEKMHLTLQFFGDADQSETAEKVARAVDGARAFDVTLDHIDAFPLRKTARVIFAGAQDPRSIMRLMRGLEAVHPHAHLTLARLPQPRTVKLQPIEPISFRAERVALVNSVLGENAKYEVLQEWKLA